MNMHVEYGEEGIWIAFSTICFYGSSNERLGKNERRKFMWVYKICICLKELGDKSFECNEVYVRVRVKKFKVDLDVVLLEDIQWIFSKEKVKVTNRLRF
jgi:hypothetical protein